MKIRPGIVTLPVLAIIGAVAALAVAWYFFQSVSDSTKQIEETNTITNRNAAVNTNTATNTNSAIISKSCSVDADCALETCSGCYNKASLANYAKNSGVFLACMMYGTGYACSCVNNTCTEISIADVTKTWKTYKSTSYGYSIRYPDKWRISEGSTIEFTSNNDSVKFVVSTLPNPTKLPLLQLLKNQYDGCVQHNPVFSCTSLHKLDWTQQTIDGAHAWRFARHSEGDAPFNVEETYIESGDKFIILTAMYFDAGDLPENYYLIYNSFVSSFVFTK